MKFKIHHTILFFLTLILGLSFVVPTYAVDQVDPVSSGTETPEDNTNIDSRQILDQRCTREKLLRGYADAGEAASDYSKLCCQDGNTETMLQCMEVLNPTYSEKGMWGNKGFNLFGTDVVLNRETIPLIIRMILTVVFAGFVIYYAWVAYQGLYEYLTAATESHKYENAEKYFTSALLGIMVGAGAIFFTYVIFRILGFKTDIFDFRPIFNETFLTDCESIKTEEQCARYDISCTWEDTCVKVDPEIQKEMKKSLDEGFCSGYAASYTCGCDEIITHDKCANNLSCSWNGTKCEKTPAADSSS